MATQQIALIIIRKPRLCCYIIKMLTEKIGKMYVFVYMFVSWRFVCMWREDGEEGYENLLAAKMEKNVCVCVGGGGGQ